MTTLPTLAIRLGGVFLISRSVLGPEGQRRRAGGRKQKQENRGLEGGPGPQGSSGLVPRWGEGGGRDGSVGRPDGRRAPSVGLTNGAVGAVGVGCTVAWAAKMHALSLVLRGFGYEIAPAARCFCFLNRGPGPSDGAGGGVLTERSKTLRPEPGFNNIKYGYYYHYTGRQLPVFFVLLQLAVQRTQLFFG